MKLVFVLLLSLVSTTLACSSIKNQHLKIKLLSNDVETYPDLFSFIENSDHKFVKSVCPKPRRSRTCQIIDVNFEAFKGRKMNFKFDHDQSNVVTLKKSTEEGMDLVLEHKIKGATATVTYKVPFKTKKIREITSC